MRAALKGHETNIGRGVRALPGDRSIGCDARIQLPSGRYINYHGLRLKTRGKRTGLELYDPRHKAFKSVWGGVFVENICQAIARDLLAETIIDAIDMGYPVPLHVHDEIVCVVPDAEAAQALAALCISMERPRTWAPSLPLGSDGGIVERYTK
jgi:DNA polymerase